MLMYLSPWLQAINKLCRLILQSPVTPLHLSVNDQEEEAERVRLYSSLGSLGFRQASLDI